MKLEADIRQGSRSEYDKLFITCPLRPILVFSFFLVAQYKELPPAAFCPRQKEQNQF